MRFACKVYYLKYPKNYSHKELSPILQRRGSQSATHAIFDYLCRDISNPANFKDHRMNNTENERTTHEDTSNHTAGNGRRNRAFVLADWFAGILAFGYSGLMLLDTATILAAVSLAVAGAGVAATPFFLKRADRFRPNNFILLILYAMLLALIITASRYELTSVAVVILAYIIINFIINISPMFRFKILRSTRYMSGVDGRDAENEKQRK